MSDFFLYVEDDEVSRNMMTFLMTRVMGLTNFMVLPNSENFRERLLALPQPPRVIFLDIQVKPLDGYEMLKLIRQEAKFESSKVVALTASVMSSDVEHLKASGFDALIGKPIRQQKFPELLNKIMRGESVWVVT